IYGNSGDLMDGLGFYSTSISIENSSYYSEINENLFFDYKQDKINEISKLNYLLKELKDSLSSKLMSNHLIPKEKKKRNDERKNIINKLFINLNCDESEKLLLIDKLSKSNYYKKN